jgi:hypothetical protein
MHYTYWQKVDFFIIFSMVPFKRSIYSIHDMEAHRQHTWYEKSLYAMGYLDLFNLYATNAVFKEWIMHNTYWQKVDFFIKKIFFFKLDH